MSKKNLLQLNSVGIYSHKKAGLGLEDLKILYGCSEEELHEKFLELNPDNGEELFKTFKSRKVKPRIKNEVEPEDELEEPEPQPQIEVEPEEPTALELQLQEREAALSQELIDLEVAWNTTDKEYRLYLGKMKEDEARLGEIQKEIKKRNLSFLKNLDRANSAIKRRNELSDEHTLLQREISVVREQIAEAQEAARQAKKVSIFIWEGGEVEYDRDIKLDISGWAAEADRMFGDPRFRNLTMNEMDALGKVIMACKELNEQDIPFEVSCESPRVKEVVDMLGLKST